MTLSNIYLNHRVFVRHPLDNNPIIGKVINVNEEMEYLTIKDNAGNVHDYVNSEYCFIEI